MNISASFATVSKRHDVGRGSALLQLLAHDDSRPANSFTVSSSGSVSGYLSMELSGSNVFLSVGHRYVGRDYNEGAGCLYRQDGSRGIVRRATIAWFGEAPTLQRLEGDPEYALVHVDFGLQSGSRLYSWLRPLWAGVVGGEFIDSDGRQAFLKVKAGEDLHIFYPDGRVSRGRWDRKAGNFLVVQLLPADALKIRLDMTERFFCGGKPDKVSRSFNELAAMLAMTALYPDLRAGVTRAVGIAVKKHNGGRVFQGGTLHAFQSVLCTLEDDHQYWWLYGEHQKAELVTKRPAHRRDNKAGRRDRDREERARMKGPARNDDSNNHRKGKK